jgi:methionyl-tRNA synthetase
MGEIYYITTPIYYVNDVPHIGHAYCTLAADILAKFKKLEGKEVFFLTGTDEHGQKVEKSALERGLDPKEHCDQMVIPFKELWKRLKIDYDRFIRTTDEDHERVVQHIFQKLYEKGDIYPDYYEGWYCVHEETFYSPSEVKDENCPVCGRKVQWVKEKAYYFRCSKYQEALLKHFEENPDFVMPEFRKNEVVSLLKSGVKDVCVSRLREKVSWGIPVPFDEEHVIYVWFDALINYLTGAGYLFDEEKFRKVWPADVHLIGKDILRFHAVIWPSMLMALGIELPRHIFATGFWTLGGEKISKSKGIVIDPVELSDEFGVDAFRYFFFREISLGQDGEFTKEAMTRRINFDLANDLGNFIHRTQGLYEKYTEGRVPKWEKKTEREKEIELLTDSIRKEISELMERLSFKETLEKIWTLVRRANKYVDETAPWQLARGKDPYLFTVLFYIAEMSRIIAILISPFMPETAVKIWKQIGLDSNYKPNLHKDLVYGIFPVGAKVQKGEPLFPRRED